MGCSCLRPCTGATRCCQPVLMLTAHGTIPDAVKALQRGVFGYITNCLRRVPDGRGGACAGGLVAALGADMPGDELAKPGARPSSRAARAWRGTGRGAVAGASDASVLIHGDSGTGMSCWRGTSIAAKLRRRGGAGGGEPWRDSGTR